MVKPKWHKSGYKKCAHQKKQTTAELCDEKLITKYDITLM